MSKEERIKKLLVSMLETLANATVDMETENMDCGILHLPVLKYIPTFEFSDEDIQLIKTLGKEELEDFSTLTEVYFMDPETKDRHCSYCKYYSCLHARFMYCSKLQHRIKASRKNGCKYFEQFDKK